MLPPSVDIGYFDSVPNLQSFMLVSGCDNNLLLKEISVLALHASRSDHKSATGRTVVSPINLFMAQMPVDCCAKGLGRLLPTYFDPNNA